MAKDKDFDIAVRELSKSRFVVNWAKGELKAYGIDPNSPEGKAFIERESIKYARKILKDRA